MKKLILIFFLACSYGYIFAQDDDYSENITKYSHGLGLGAGFTTGYGLQYRHFFPNKFGIQGSFSPYKSKEETTISLGLTFMYRLVEGESANFFVYQGNHFFYNKNDYEYGYYEVNNNKTEKYFNNGVGIGLELAIFQRIGINLMTGYAGYVNFKRITMTGEVGAYFYF